MRRAPKTLNELVIELSQAPARPNICTRCNFIFAYPKDASWSEAFHLVCEHWKACLADVHGDAVPPLSGDTNGKDRQSFIPAIEREAAPPRTKRKRSGSRSPEIPFKTHKKHVMDKGERRRLIEGDMWARNATPKSVECKGCGRTIKLDKRSDYYPGLWQKHRNKCPAIHRIEGGREEKPVWVVVCDARRAGADVLHQGDHEEAVIRERPRRLTEAGHISPSVEGLTATSETRGHLSRWAATSGLRYNELSSHATSSSSRSTPADEKGSNTLTAHVSSSRYPGMRNAVKGIRGAGARMPNFHDAENSDDDNCWGDSPFQPGQNDSSSPTMHASPSLYTRRFRKEIQQDGAEMSELKNAENSDDESYWDDAPFRPETMDPSDSASGRRLYRYSTRRELLTGHGDGALQGRILGELCSDEVLQAACCLVSMKSRTEV